MLNKLEKIKERYDELSQLLSDPQIFSNKEKFLQLTKEHKETEEIVKIYIEYKDVKNQIQGDKQILAEENDKELIEIAEQELKELKQRESELEEKSN